jgi:hypothetical protein
MEAKIDEENWLWVPIIFYYSNTSILFQKQLRKHFTRAKSEPVIEDI